MQEGRQNQKSSNGGRRKLQLELVKPRLRRALRHGHSRELVFFLRRLLLREAERGCAQVDVVGHLLLSRLHGGVDRRGQCRALIGFEGSRDANLVYLNWRLALIGFRLVAINNNLEHKKD